MVTSASQSRLSREHFFVVDLSARQLHASWTAPASRIHGSQDRLLLCTPPPSSAGSRMAPKVTSLQGKVGLAVYLDTTRFSLPGKMGMRLHDSDHGNVCGRASSLLPRHSHMSCMPQTFLCCLWLAAVEYRAHQSPRSTALVCRTSSTAFLGSSSSSSRERPSNPSGHLWFSSRGGYCYRNWPVLSQSGPAVRMRNRRPCDAARARCAEKHGFQARKRQTCAELSSTTRFFR